MVAGKVVLHINLLLFFYWVYDYFNSCFLMESQSSLYLKTFTPRMQSTIDIGEPKTASYKKKNFARTASLGNKKKENFSTEIWIKAFSDACERLCPVRAEGHGCGCLPILARLVSDLSAKYFF